MSEPLQRYDVGQQTHDRIHDIYETAAELRAARRPTDGHAGLVTRTRWSIGRRLISIGGAVSGQHA